MSISKQFQHFHQEDLGRKVDEIIDAINNNFIDKTSTTPQSIDSDLTINGVLKQTKYELDTPIIISNLPEGLYSNYAHARVSNGKLNIVISLYTSSIAINSFTNTDIGSLSLEEEILSKLNPIYSSFLCADMKTMTSIDGLDPTNLSMPVTKGTSGISFGLTMPSNKAAGRALNARFEFNFILS